MLGDFAVTQKESLSLIVKILLLSLNNFLITISLQNIQGCSLIFKNSFMVCQPNLLF